MFPAPCPDHRFGCAEYLLLMPLEKRNVADELHEAGWRPRPSAVVRMAAELARALAHLHAMGDPNLPPRCRHTGSTSPCWDQPQAILGQDAPVGVQS